MRPRCFQGRTENGKTSQRHTQSVTAAPIVSLSRWNALERAVDRWASVGALALGLVVGVVFVLVGS